MKPIRWLLFLVLLSGVLLLVRPDDAITQGGGRGIPEHFAVRVD